MTTVPQELSAIQIKENVSSVTLMLDATLMFNTQDVSLVQMSVLNVLTLLKIVTKDNSVMKITDASNATTMITVSMITSDVRIISALNV